MSEKRELKAGTARAMHITGNVLLGFALGLACYYGITDVLAAQAQSDLKTSLTDLGPIAAEAPPVSVPEPDEWEGWSDDDLAYWQGIAGGSIFGRLIIDTIELDAIVVKGTEREHLKEGPGWIVQTDPPGETGNCAISGHRTTYGAPFRDIDQLVPGDLIVLYSPYRKYTYEMVEQLIVRPSEVGVVASTETPMLTLTACHPPYSAEFRIIVHSELVEVERLEGVPDA